MRQPQSIEQNNANLTDTEIVARTTAAIESGCFDSVVVQLDPLTADAKTALKKRTNAAMPRILAICERFGAIKKSIAEPNIAEDEARILAAETKNLLCELSAIVDSLTEGDAIPIAVFNKSNVVDFAPWLRKQRARQAFPPYSTIGAKLVERGYSAIPIMPGTKRPGELRGGEWVGKSNWREEYTKRLPTQFEIDYWSRSDAGVGVVCGPASKGLIGIDIDTDDETIKSAILAVLPGTNLRKVGKKGECLFFRSNEITESPSWNITDPTTGKSTRVCDLIGPGRQTLLPPTVHPDTNEPYRWIGGAALEDTDPDDIPELPADVIERIGEALKPFGWRLERKGERRQANREDGTGTSIFEDPFRKLNEDALDNLDAWVPALGLYRCRRTRTGYEAVATWRSSNTRQTHDKRKLNLKIDRKGIVDFGDGPRGYTPIDLVMASSPCDMGTAFGLLVDRLWSDLPQNVRFVNSREAPSIAPDGATEEPVDALTDEHADALTEEPADALTDAADALTEKPADAPTDAADAPSNEAPQHSAQPSNDDSEATGGALEALTHVPGLVGDIIDWIEKSAMRPNRILALGTALVVIGTVLGRTVGGPTRSGTHLYIVGLAKTGGGKQHIMNCAEDLLKAAGAAQHVGPTEFVSMQGAINAVSDKALCLCLQDEFGSFLKRVNSKRASSFESQISKFMREMWGLSFRTYRTPESAQRRSRTIISPALSLYGLSTFEEFYEALQSGDLSNGFLNRFIVLSSDTRAPEQEPDESVLDVPEEIAANLQYLYRWGGRDSVMTATLSNPDVCPKPDFRPWANDEARAVYQQFRSEIDERCDKEPGVEKFIGRYSENAVRLATIRAAGRCDGNYDFAIDESDIQWAIDVVRACGERLIAQACMYMVEDELSHGQAIGTIIRILREKGPMKHSDLLRKVQKQVKARDFEAIIGQLTASETVKKEKHIPKRGPQCVVYRLTGKR